MPVEADGSIVMHVRRPFLEPKEAKKNNYKSMRPKDPACPIPLHSGLGMRRNLWPHIYICIYDPMQLGNLYNHKRVEGLGKPQALQPNT